MNKTDDEHVIRDSIMGGFIVILLICIFISIYCFRDFSAILTGMFFLYFGICIATIAKPKRSTNKLVGALFGIVGFGLMSVALIAKYGNELNIHINLNALIPILLLFSITLPVIFTMLIDATEKKEKLLNCTMPIMATCVELISSDSDSSSMTPRYSYIYDGSQYSSSSDSFSNFGLPKIGSTTEILINPSDPNESYIRGTDEQNVMKKGIEITILAIIFPLIIIILFYQYKNIFL